MIVVTTSLAFRRVAQRVRRPTSRARLRRRFKPQSCYVRPLRVRGCRAAVRKINDFGCIGTLIVCQKVATDIRFLQTETLLPFSIHFHRGRRRQNNPGQPGQAIRQKPGEERRLCRCACRTARRSLAKLVDKPREIDGVRGQRRRQVLRRLIPRLRAFAYSAARAFERTQARSRFSFGAGGLAFLDLETQCDNRSR